MALIKFNEYLKHGTENIIKLIVTIFNVILLKGIFLDDWLFGIVKTNLQKQRFEI